MRGTRMNAETKTQTQFRVVVGKDASDALDGVVAIVNEGFTSGSVSRTDLASYLFKNAKRFIGKTELERIRNEFFDERLALEKLLRSSTTSGKLPDEIRKLLKDQFRNQPDEKK